ncbi:hypothetical protein HHL17_03965 [Chitinophaga sp. G-6-1-13]|uniref:HhH-GPD domain-containing protein n=1 Tax=Chitinophaga fulva TaxID=2728842 RepID=A0A848GEA0_9BACT|nr:hypothetical protein [Chitinophaga fulva]NML36346.1 hypothetical protein [Chitinophaga fulva]
MKLTWEISTKDISAIRNVYLKQKAHPVFTRRLNENILCKQITLTKESLWTNIFTCLLTTQQRSSEDSKIYLFLKDGFQPLKISSLKKVNNIEKHIRKQLKGFGGIRRNIKIPKEAHSIYHHLNETNWDLLKTIKKYCKEHRGDAIRERELANIIVNTPEFKGLGPKQSRNLIQMIGYSQFEIPIDSRITDWLNKNIDLPFILNSKGLADNEFYGFVNDAIILLCKEAKIKPCMFDAAVFSLKEKNSN